MPLSKEHKMLVRDKIVKSAQILFNRESFKTVSIDMVMKQAGLTRGGFYNHFNTKDDLYDEAVSDFLIGHSAKSRANTDYDPATINQKMADHIIQSYLSPKHLSISNEQLPMIAIPTEMSKTSQKVRSSYQNLLVAMVSLFEKALEGSDKDVRTNALSLSALCVGGMVLTKTLPDSDLVSEIQASAKDMANELLKN